MKHYYKRNLPHYIVEGYAYFITTRLAKSLPNEIIKMMKDEYKNKLTDISAIKNTETKREEYNKLKWTYFQKFDIALHKFNKSPHYLKNVEIAQIIKDALHYKDKKEWELITYTIMSNHIHMIILPNFEKIRKGSNYADKYPLGKILGSFKKYTASQANKKLKREGSFWQIENYDHIIRNSDELKKIVKYILNNPVKIGLVNNYENYKWNYYNPEYIDM